MSDAIPPAGAPVPPAKEAPAQAAAITTPIPKEGDQVFRVSGGTDCKRLAGAIAGSIQNEHKNPVLEFIGAGACIQAVKAVAISNSILSRTGQYVTMLPKFVRRSLEDNHDTTGMQLQLIVHDIR